MKQRCKTCRKKTEHGPVVERTDERDNISRCHVCGQRPDRPKDGHLVKVTCPRCGKTTKASYCDDDGMDSLSVECSACDFCGIIEYRENYGYSRQKFLKDRNTAKAIAKAEGRMP